MAEIVLTDENRPLIDAVIRISATRWPEHAEEAEDTLVEAVQELIALRHENAAMREIVQAVADAPAYYQAIDVPMASGRTATMFPAVIGLDIRERARALLASAEHPS